MFSHQVGLVLYNLYKGVPALGPEDGHSGQAIAAGVARHRAECVGSIPAPPRPSPPYLVAG